MGGHPVRLANLEGRAVVVLGAEVADVERRSAGRFSSDPMQVLGRWEEFRSWASGLGAGDADAPLDEERLGSPVARPRNVFAIGLNYRHHAAEAKLDVPAAPMVFTKFPSCVTGPRDSIRLTSDRVDWEVELVAAIGRAGRHIPEQRALEHVAGFCVGQDVSDRRVQFRDKPPQFSLGKSADGYGPLGPVLVSLDAFADPGDLALACDVSGEPMQRSRTSDMIFGVPQLVAHLSSFCTLAPGDLIFTGTPAGVGSLRDPPRYLRDGDAIVSEIEGIGRLVNRCLGP